MQVERERLKQPLVIPVLGLCFSGGVLLLLDLLHCLHLAQALVEQEDEIVEVEVGEFEECFLITT